ncbi:hypothetical protein [Roseivirga sp.]|uniref:hypothetical protein n=1 Tax=Roseivirga sp. TaxID=1964215 RepID=UPI003B8D9202
MKSIILKLGVLALLFSANQAFSQRVYESEVVDTAAVQREVYAQVRVRPRFLSNKVSIRLDYGQERNFWGGDTRIRDENSGKVKKFNSAVDALNYMSSQGWEFVFAYTLPIGDGRDNVAAQTAVSQEVNFLMKKRLR